MFILASNIDQAYLSTCSVQVQPWENQTKPWVRGLNQEEENRGTPKVTGVPGIQGMYIQTTDKQRYSSLTWRLGT
jgi:hypothetical protein